MAWSLFSGRALLWLRSERRLDTEREVRAALENRVLLLLFAAPRCPRCREFEPRLRRFCRRLTDPAHVERPEQLRLIYLGRQGGEQEHRRYLRAMPRAWMALPHGDPLPSELADRFGVSELPAVVVLAPSGAVLVPNAVAEIRDSGPACFRAWREAAELLDRNFQEREDTEKPAPRSFTEPLRKLKYRLWDRDEHDDEHDDHDDDDDDEEGEKE
ncbi:nucleoredoxin-like protein 1 [Chamaea fasciata]|uniref:nucleoredoxin-like protein 1 n=1 Tax=Chamaea fasciata TaxID=190680 RepID=UPI00336AA2B5